MWPHNPGSRRSISVKRSLSMAVLMSFFVATRVGNSEAAAKSEHSRAVRKSIWTMVALGEDAERSSCGNRAAASFTPLMSRRCLLRFVIPRRLLE
jgi:hypothetical protein